MFNKSILTVVIFSLTILGCGGGSSTEPAGGKDIAETETNKKESSFKCFNPNLWTVNTVHEFEKNIEDTNTNYTSSGSYSLTDGFYEGKPILVKRNTAEDGTLIFENYVEVNQQSGTISLVRDKYNNTANDKYFDIIFTPELLERSYNLVSGESITINSHVKKESSEQSFPSYKPINDINGTLTFVGFEPIETSKGTFNTCKFKKEIEKTTYHNSQPLYKSYYTEKYWVTVDHGLEIRHEFSNGTYTRNRYLTSYKIDDVELFN